MTIQEVEVQRKANGKLSNTLCSDILFVLLSILYPCLISILHPSIYAQSTYLPIHPASLNHICTCLPTYPSIIHPQIYLLPIPAFSRHPPIQPTTYPASLNQRCMHMHHFHASIYPASIHRSILHPCIIQVASGLLIHPIYTYDLLHTNTVPQVETGQPIKTKSLILQRLEWKAETTRPL